MTESSPKKLQVAFAAAEATPFVKTGGLGDVAGSLPAELARAGADVVVFVPKYDVIDERYTSAMTHLCDFTVRLSWRKAYCGLEELDLDGVRYLFVDNEQYFKRGYPYGFFDDGERFAFFSAAIVESLQHIPGFECDVLHCNDWHTALAPVFLRELHQGDPLYENVKTVFSIHNIAFQGQFSASMIDDVCGLDRYPAAVMQLSSGYDSMNCMQGALNYADAIATVSPTYAQEIQTPEYGEGLDGLLRWRSSSLHGIVNGLDTKSYDPARNPCLTAPYSVEDRAGKAACKAALQEELGLEVDPASPLAIMVSRLTRQKGVDLVVYALDRILDEGVQVAVLGTGDVFYEDVLCDAEARHPGRMAARIDFDNALSQRMYSGADLLLMPSLFEPCGISQLIAMRYGTLPVVRETGGLKDTVTPYNRYTGEGTGFSFANFNGDEFADTVLEAAAVYRNDQDAWQQLVTQAMSQDFGWEQSAAAYMDLYYGLHPELRPDASEGDEAENGEIEGGEQAVPFPVNDAVAASQPPAAVSEETETAAEAAEAEAAEETSAAREVEETSPNNEQEAAEDAAEALESTAEDMTGTKGETVDAAAEDTADEDGAAASEAAAGCDGLGKAADEAADNEAAAGTELANEATAESFAETDGKTASKTTVEADDPAALSPDVDSLNVEAAQMPSGEDLTEPEEMDDGSGKPGDPESVEASESKSEKDKTEPDEDDESAKQEESDEDEKSEDEDDAVDDDEDDDSEKDKESEDNDGDENESKDDSDGDDDSDDEDDDSDENGDKDSDDEDEDDADDDDEDDYSDKDDEHQDKDDKSKKAKTKKKDKKNKKSGKKGEFSMKDETDKSDKKNKKNKSGEENEKNAVGTKNEAIAVCENDDKDDESSKKGKADVDEEDGEPKKKDKKVKRSKKSKKKSGTSSIEDGDVVVKKVVKKTKKKTVKKVKGGSNDAEGAESAGHATDGGTADANASAKR